MPLAHKDGIKESLYNTLGIGDRAHSRRLGAASVVVQRQLSAEFLAARVSHILECNFQETYDGRPLRQLLREQNACAAQIWLTAEQGALLERFAARAVSDVRHKGHVESDNLEEMRAAIASSDDCPLDLPGPILALDTTDFARLDYSAALAFTGMTLGGATLVAHSS
ncbi:MAG TPA: hypothetical protein VF808_01070 [Ktedonobacterales bacterium]